MNILPIAQRFLFGTVVYEPGGGLGPRTQSNVQIVLVHRGSADIRVDGTHRHLEAGEMTLLLPGHTERFEFARNERTHHTWIHGEQPVLPAARVEWLRRAPDAVRITSRMEHLMDLGLELRGAAQGEAMSHLLYDQLATAAFLEFLIAADLRPPEEAPVPLAVRKALDILNAEYRSELDLPAIASRSGVSEQHLMRLFRQHVGVPPIRTLWQIRTREAERLLAETGLTVSEIADRCGFQNVFHLSRLVRRRTGLSPTRLRRKQWAK